jgi:micrococcal nuclease
MRVSDRKSIRAATVLVTLASVLLILALQACASERDAHQSDAASPGASASANEPALSAGNEPLGGGDPSASAPAELTEATVTNVVDGDTVDVSTGSGTSTRIRLIGLDAPESVHPDASKNTVLGELASEYTHSQLLGRQVGLELDVQESDEYGRTLAYVWLDNELFNARIIRDGYAQVSTYPPNVKYTDLLLASQEQAREANVGMWGVAAGAPDAALSWSEAINHIGETATFTGKVVGTRYASNSNGKPTFLNVGADFPDSSRLTILIWGADRGNFPSTPESMYAGKTIVVTGLVELYNGAAEIQVSSPSQIEVLD